LRKKKIKKKQKNKKNKQIDGKNNLKGKPVLYRNNKGI
jgi:hypothetical protein